MIGHLAKWPHQYAAEILRLPTVEQRRAALAAVPEEWRERVVLHVKNEFERRRYARDRSSRTVADADMEASSRDYMLAMRPER